MALPSFLTTKDKVTKQGEPGSGLQVYFNNEVIRKIIRAATATPNVEIGGVLIGRVYGNDLDVSDALEARRLPGAPGAFTFAPEHWDYFHRELDQRPDSIMVGWYHSHLGIGLFLSPDDRFINQYFFRERHHIAIVYDLKQGLGVWKWTGKAEMERCGFYVYEKGGVEEKIVISEEEFAPEEKISITEKETLETRLKEIELLMILAEKKGNVVAYKELGLEMLRLKRELEERPPVVPQEELEKRKTDLKSLLDQLHTDMGRAFVVGYLKGKVSIPKEYLNKSKEWCDAELRTLQKALPEDRPEYRNMNKEILDAEGNPQKIKELYNKAIELHRKNLWGNVCYETLARVAKRSGLTEEAKNAYKLAVEKHEREGRIDMAGKLAKEAGFAQDVKVYETISKLIWG